MRRAIRSFLLAIAGTAAAAVGCAHADDSPPDAQGAAETPATPVAAEPEPRSSAIEGLDPPMYKPSSYSKGPMAITDDAYGRSKSAPNAPRIGDVAQDFALPLADGGRFELAQARGAGPVLIMFYRGFW